jgi:dipeptidase E
MTRTIIAIGGGEIKSKGTLEIDRKIAELTKKNAGERRANALFFPTASHDSMPYFNSFRKTYTSVFDIKVDVALMCYGEMSIEKISTKIDWADMIYVGGGDTVFMIDKWKELGVDTMLLNAYKKGTIICGLSAGAICWFEKMYSDSGVKASGEGNYCIYNGLGLLKGVISPHYNHREKDFDEIIVNNFEQAYAIEDNAAIIFENEELTKFITCGGRAYLIENKGGILKKNAI